MGGGCIHPARLPQGMPDHRPRRSPRFAGTHGGAGTHRQSRCPRRTGRQQDESRRHPVAYQRRTRNLPPGQGLATLGLRQTFARVGEPEYGQSLGDGMA